jgi:phosphatidylserine decarboxylase
LPAANAFLERCAIDLSECAEPLGALDSARKIFERKIRYWQCRPMSEIAAEIVCPADSRVLFGSLRESSGLFLKSKFFDYEELLGFDKPSWLKAFDGGDFMICRLTPDKYHYNHTPVAGVVRDFYMTDGQYHSCNPGALLTLATPHSKNKRTITIIDTDVSGGTDVGLVAMIEVVALMIGDILC